MNNDNVKKQLEALEKRIKELESKQKSNQQIFGRSYSQIGDSNSDFLIKTRGQIKVQWGNKFIDLIKDGKINYNAKFIYKGSPGTKDGIYVDDENIWVVIDGQSINISGEIGTTYVSFLKEQDTTSDQKYTAQSNIGLIADTQDNINITSGIVYVESENKLYLVNNGKIQELTFEFPNPYPKQFVITKNDSNIGSLLIKGSGKNNSLAFDGLYIYKDGDSFIESDSILNILVKNKNIISADIYQTLFQTDVISNMFKSQGATSESGFRLYYDNNNQSTLEVDNLVWRNNKDSNYIGEHWFSITNIVSDVNVNEENDDNNYTKFIFTLSQSNIFKQDDILLSFLQKETTVVINENTDDEEEYSIIELTPIYFTVTSSSDNYVEVTSNFELSEDDIKNIIQKIIYRVNPENPIRIKDNNLDILEFSKDLESVSKLRIGDVNKEIIDNSKTSKKDEIKGSGIYSDIGLFKEISYTSDYTLDEDDDSSRLASTEWVKKQDKEATIWGQKLKASNYNITGNMINVGDIRFDGDSKVIGSMTNSSLRPNYIYSNGTVAVTNYNGNPWEYSTNMKNIGTVTFVNSGGLTLNSVVDYYGNGHYYNNSRILWNVYNPESVQLEGNWWLGPTWANDYDDESVEDDHKIFALYPDFDPGDMVNDNGNPSAEFYKLFQFIIGAKLKSQGYIVDGGRNNQILMADGSIKNLSELGTISLPIGSIIMFDGSNDIPEGWEIYEDSSKINTLSLNNIENDVQSEHNQIIFIIKKS